MLTSPERARRLAEQVRPTWDENPPLVAGANRPPHDAGLTYRVLGLKTEPDRAQMRTFEALARAKTVDQVVPPAT
jgi:urease accessory protein